MSTPVVAKRCGYSDMRALTRNDTRVGLALLCTNGQWKLCDTNGKPIVSDMFKNPEAAAKCLGIILAEPQPTGAVK